MPMQVQFLSLISAVQAMVLAGMMWAGTPGEPGAARTSLRLRAAALALEAAGWGMLALENHFSQGQLLLGGNALNLLAQGMGVLALRMLLDVPLRWRLLLAVGVFGWLGVAWFGVGQPDYRLRVLWGSVAIMVNILLSVQALRSDRERRNSRARSVLLLVLALAAALLVWRNTQLWFSPAAPGAISQPSFINAFYVLFSGMQPLFASIGFLLLYNEVLQRKLHLLARVDPLTGVGNRLALNEAANRLLAQAIRWRRPLGVLMLDADHFKSVNDRFGHGGGDKVLLELVESIRAALRADDVIGRVGGEEFAVLMPDTGPDGAEVVAERIRSAVECTPLIIEGHVVQLTVSIGVAVALADERDARAILQRADMALYSAKRAGRNRVCAATIPQSMMPA
jgi:diguanylate cyclase (GGDEF)-like protein